MKRIFAFVLAVFVVMGIAPFALAVPTKDATLDPIINGAGTSLEFVNDPTHPWVSATVNGERYAKTTIAGMSNASTSINAATVVEAGTILSFDYIVSSEANFDRFIFGYVTEQYPEGKVLFMESGERQGTYTHLITETNVYAFVWLYAKDSSNDSGNDCVCLRNVRLTQASTPTSFNIDQASITLVPGGTSTLTASFTPENSYAALSWSSSNQSVATVDSNGVVTGVAEGNAVITATFGSVSDTVDVTVVALDGMPFIEGVRIYSERDYTVGRIRNYMLPDGSNVTLNQPLSLASENIKSGSYYNGVIYLVNENTLYAVDYDTGEADEIGVCGVIRDMTYDYTSGRMLGVISDEDNAEIQYIVEVDLTTGTTSRVCTVDQKIIAIAANEGGVIYAMTAGTGELCTIDLATGATTSVMATNVATQYLQSMTFDFNTGMLYWASCTQNTEDLYEIDLDAQTATMIFQGFGEVVGMFVPVELGETVPVTGITLNQSSVNIGLGETATITPNVTPINASNKRVTWSSSNVAVATVSNGVVKGEGPGNAVITATTVDGGFTATCAVTVTSDYVLYEDFEDEPQGWTILDADGDGHTWMSLAQFALGQLPAYEGSDMYTSQSYINGNQYTGEPGQVLDPDNWLISPEVTIPQDIESVTLSWLAGSQDTSYLDKYSVYIGSGDAVPSTFTTTLYNGTAPGNGGEFSADLTAYAGQTVRVAFRHHNSSDHYMLNIDMIKIVASTGEEEVPVSGVTLDKSSAEMFVGDTLTLTATVMPENATNKNVVWTTSNAEVATVENGVVTAVGEGEAVITVKTEDGNFTATCTITVTEQGEDPTVMEGDVTGDGKLNTGDAVAMLRKIAGLSNTTYIAEVEDFNNDGQFNTGDAVAVLRRIAGLA